MKDDPRPLDELLKPVSAKTQRPRWTVGGRPMSASHARMADAKKFAAAVERRKRDADRRNRGTL